MRPYCGRGGRGSAPPSPAWSGRRTSSGRPRTAGRSWRWRRRCTGSTARSPTTCWRCPPSSSMRGCWSSRCSSPATSGCGGRASCGSSRWRSPSSSSTSSPGCPAGLTTRTGWCRPSSRPGPSPPSGGSPLIGAAAALPVVLPVLPVGHLHDVPGLHKLNSDIGDTVGWPQLVGAVAAADAELTRSGRPPGSVFAEAYGEAAALDVYGSAYHLPPVLSGDNTYWMWGPGRASDQTVLVVDALGELRPYFARCRVLTTYDAPYQVQNDWTGVQIGVCTGPAADWRVLWPHLRFYG